MIGPDRPHRIVQLRHATRLSAPITDAKWPFLFGANLLELRTSEVRGIVGPGSYAQGFAGREERLLETQGCHTGNLRASWASTEGRMIACRSCRSCSRYLRGVCGGVRRDPDFSRFARIFFGRGARASPVLAPCRPCAEGRANPVFGSLAGGQAPMLPPCPPRVFPVPHSEVPTGAPAKGSNCGTRFVALAPRTERV
jgi:hypothetical protein